MSQKITDAFLRNLRPTEEIQKINVAEGLSLWVRPSGKKIWYLRYYTDGKRQIATIGSYPTLTLAKAQAAAEDLKQKARIEGVNLGQEAKRVRRVKIEEAQEEQRKEGSTFRAVAESWLEKKSTVWVKGHLKRRREKLEGYLYHSIGNKVVSQITMADIDAIIRPYIKDGKIETAKRTCDLIRNVMEHAELMELIDNSLIPVKIARYRKEIPTPPRKNFYQEMSPAQIGTLLQAIHASEMRWTKATASALKLAPYVFLRATELCEAKWSEIDLEKGEWLIPAERMKARREHLVPLSRQAIEILQDIKTFTGSSEYVFPSQAKPWRPITTSALLVALRRLGYGTTRGKGRTEEKEAFCTHAFRGIASSSLYQVLKYPGDYIEHQLAHVEDNKVKAAYNQISARSYLEERREMMQRYADYLDSLRAQAKNA